MQKSEKSQKSEYLNKNCWLVKVLNYAPYKRCQYCELKFHHCLFLHYQIISLILTLFLLTLSFLIDGRIPELVIISVFTLVIVYGYFFNKSTDKIIQANFAQRKAKEALEELTGSLQEKVDEQTRHLKKLFQVKTEFLHIVSHQLRTPLTALRGLLSMWSEGMFDDYPAEEKQKVKQRISTSCERLNNITNDMLDTLDLEEGYAKFILEPLDMVKIIDDIVEFLKPNFDKKGLSLEVRKPEKPPPRVLGDKQYLPQALQNLVDNAEKYTFRGGLVITLSQPDDTHLQISFKDTGIGVLPQEKEHLFKDKFFRGERADRINTAGSGLGLYIVKNIIDGHQGTIEVKSEGENKGTEFVVGLPVAK